MLGFWFLCALVLVPAFSLPQGSGITDAISTENSSFSNNGTEPQDLPFEYGPPMSLEDFLYDLFIKGRGLKDNSLLRTWRVNRKALVPILVGMAIKALAIIPLALTGLSIMGALAILVSKTSLAISGIMFLRRFFSHDSTHGGFFGLNPFNFPHGTIASQDQHQGYGTGTGNRRTTYVIRGRSNQLNKKTENILKHVEEAYSNYGEGAEPGLNYVEDDVYDASVSSKMENFKQHSD